MACTANHDSGLPQSRHWCENFFRLFNSALHPHLGSGRIGVGMDPQRVGSDPGGGGGGKACVLLQFQRPGAIKTSGGPEAQNPHKNPNQQGP